MQNLLFQYWYVFACTRCTLFRLVINWLCLGRACELQETPIRRRCQRILRSLRHNNLRLCSAFQSKTAKELQLQVAAAHMITLLVCAFACCFSATEMTCILYFEMTCIIVSGGALKSTHLCHLPLCCLNNNKCVMK